MKERIIDIATQDGKMETFITHPEQGGPFHPVVVYMDVWGIREELYDVARRIATVGYYAMVPDLYYRQGKVRHEFRDATGKMISLHSLSEADQKKVTDPLTKLPNHLVVQDTKDIIAFLGKGEPVKTSGMGSIGFCMGGRHVMCVAAAYPEHFKASAGLHPTSLISDRKSSPHKDVGKMQGEVYCGFAETDPYAPLSMVAELAELFKASPAKYQYEIHKGAVHGYALPDRDIFDKRAFNRDWELIFAMYRRQIPPA